MKIKDPKKFNEFVEKHDRIWQKQERALAKASRAKNDKEYEKASQQVIKTLIDSGNLMEKYFDYDENEKAKQDAIDDHDDGL